MAIAVALRGPIEDDLLDGNETLFWIGVASVAAYGASYFARGFLAGSHRLTLYALLIISESLSRTAFPLAVALGIATGQDFIALGIVAAPTVSLIVVPFAFLRRSRPARGGRLRAGDRASIPPPATSRSPKGGGFAAAVFLIMLSEQTFLNAGPAPDRRERRRGSRRVHLQRADDRAGAAAAVPGGLDQPPPPPHPAAGSRARRPTSAPRSG